MQDIGSLAPFTTRVPTGITGADAILRGGLFRGGSYLITGEPGNGKTIFANQLAFHTVAQGGRVVYVTLLTETHDQLIAQVRALEFFDPEALGQNLLYLSGTKTLLESGMDGLRTLLRDVVRDHQATLLVIDRLTPAETVAASELAFEQFIREFQAFVAARGCTTVILTGHVYGGYVAAWGTLVDGVIRLSDELMEHRAVRFLEVQKFRGSDHLRGRHVFEITQRGIEVYPRMEALYTLPTVAESEDVGRLQTGVPTLDTLLHGGLMTGSTTLLLGPAGCGKTSLGLAFLAEGAHAEEPGLYFGFYERPLRLLRKADQIGVPLRQAVAAEQVTIRWQPPLEDYIDRLLAELLAEVRRRGVRRLFIDGLDGLHSAAIYPDRLRPAFTALVNELRALEVTVLFSLDLPEMISPSVSVPANGISAISDNLIVVRTVEAGPKVRQVLEIMKVRDSDYDSTIHHFIITAQGIKLTIPEDGAEPRT